MPKTITHELKLARAQALVDQFVSECSGLGRKLGAVLVQLAPSHELNRRTVAAFFTHLTGVSPAPVLVEARHATWFAPSADDLLRERNVGRVAADPAPVAEAALPRAWSGLVYYRLHGSPRMYSSSYQPEYLQHLAQQLERHRAEGVPTWCIFDNTAYGVATHNAFELRETLERAVG